MMHTAMSVAFDVILWFYIWFITVGERRKGRDMLQSNVMFAVMFTAMCDLAT